MKTFIRWLYVIRTYRNYANYLNVRVKVEQELWNCYRDKSPLPDKEKCREWAIRLGVRS